MSAGTGVANPAVPETAVVSATGERTGIQAGPAVFPEEAGSAAGAVSGRAGDFVFSGGLPAGTADVVPAFSGTTAGFSVSHCPPMAAINATLAVNWRFRISHSVFSAEMRLFWATSNCK